MRRRAVLAVLAAGLFWVPPGQAQTRAPFDVRPFAPVPNPPGLPEGIAVENDGTVYVSTNPGGQNPGPQFGARSKVFAYGPDGDLRREYVLDGQDLTAAALPAYGNQAIALDREGIVYVGDKVPARIIRLDPRTGAQRDYVTFPDLRPCGLAGAVAGNCSATATDLRPQPDYLSFASDGSLYVTDFQQATIWRVPPGGGRAEIAFTDFRLDGGMGPNGSQILADGRTLMFVQSVNPPGTGTPGAGRLYTLHIGDDGGLSDLRLFYETLPGDVPDGFAVGRSGTVYLNIAQQMTVVSPTGSEVRRVPATQVENQAQAIPFDNPASAAFSGDRLLVTNQALITRDPAHFAILDVNVGEPGLPLFRPSETGATATPAPAPARILPRPRPRLRISVSPRSDRRGPRRFTTAGRLIAPEGLSSRAACNGRVFVDVKAGRNTISTRHATVRANCSFRSSVTLRLARRFGNRRRLSLRVRFAGNPALLSQTANTTVRVR